MNAEFGMLISEVFECTVAYRNASSSFRFSIPQTKLPF